MKTPIRYILRIVYVLSMSIAAPQYRFVCSPCRVSFNSYAAALNHYLNATSTSHLSLKARLVQKHGYENLATVMGEEIEVLAVAPPELANKFLRGDYRLPSNFGKPTIVTVPTPKPTAGAAGDMKPTVTPYPPANAATDEDKKSVMGGFHATEKIQAGMEMCGPPTQSPKYELPECPNTISTVINPGKRARRRRKIPSPESTALLRLCFHVQFITPSPATPSHQTMTPMQPSAQIFHCTPDSLTATFPQLLRCVEAAYSSEDAGGSALFNWEQPQTETGLVRWLGVRGKKKKKGALVVFVGDERVQRVMGGMKGREWFCRMAVGGAMWMDAYNHPWVGGKVGQL